MARRRSCSSTERSGSTEHEHLDLVELVHAEDPARVLARGASLAAEARREAGVAQRQVGGLEDLAGVHRRERDLARPDEVQVVVGQAVDLLLGVGQEAGSVERLLAHEDRGDHRLEAVALDLLERPADERELEHDERAAEVGEARPGETRAALHVDHVAREGEVVAALADPRLSDLAEDRVLGRRGRVGQVRERREHRLQALLGRPRALGERLDLRGHVAHALHDRPGVLAGALRRRDALRRRLLLVAQVLRRRVGGAPVLVQIQDLVEAIGVAAAGERLAHGVGVAADQSQVEHGAPSVRRIHATGRCGNPPAWPRGRRRLTARRRSRRTARRP